MTATVTTDAIATDSGDHDGLPRGVLYLLLIAAAGVVNTPVLALCTFGIGFSGGEGFWLVTGALLSTWVVLTLAVMAVQSESTDLRICLLIMMVLAIALTNLPALVICRNNARVFETLLLDTLYSSLMFGVALWKRRCSVMSSACPSARA